MQNKNKKKKGIENFKAAIVDNVSCQRSVYTKTIGRVVRYIKVQMEENFWWVRRERSKTNAEIRKTLQLEKNAEKEDGTVKG